MQTPLAFYHCLDEEFDFDAEADYELCRAIVAGRAGLHPDAWGSYDPLTILPPRFRRHEPDLGYELAIDPDWEAKRRPVEEPPAIIPVLLGPAPLGTWTSPYPS